MGARSGDELVVAARRGDDDAWAALYRAHAGRLLVWLRSAPVIDAATSAEDVAAEAWLTAAGKITSFVGDDDAFAGWLFGIARLVASNRRRTASRRATEPHSVHDEPDGYWGTASDHAGAVAGQDRIAHLLARLPRREAEVVACVDVVGLDVATTAAALGMSATAVRVAHHRGLKKLRAHLATALDGRSVLQDPSGIAAGKASASRARRRTARPDDPEGLAVLRPDL